MRVRRTHAVLTAVGLIVAGLTSPGPGAPAAHGTAPPSPLDPTFGTGGSVVVPDLQSAFVEPDGRIVVQRGDQLVRLLDDGRPDPSFTAATGLTALALDTAFHPPRVLVFDANRHLGRLLDNGAFDNTYTSFDPAAHGGLSCSSAASDAGRLLLLCAGPTDIVLLRVRGDGTLDPGFGTAGVVTTPHAARQPPGLVRTVGLRVSVDGTVTATVLEFASVAGDTPGSLRILRWSPTGAADAAFAPWASGGVTVNTAGAGELVVGADGSAVVTVDADELLRIRADGTPDERFGPAGRAVSGLARRLATSGAVLGYDRTSLAHTADGRLLLTGSQPLAQSVGGELRYGSAPFVAAIDDRGQLDTTFGSCGVLRPFAPSGPGSGRSTPTASVAIDGSGRLLLTLRSFAPDASSITRLVPVLTASASACGSAFAPVPPTRLLDTRDGTGAPIGRPAAGAQVELPLAGRALTDGRRVPTMGVAAVVLNVTATNAVAAGFVTAWPSGSTRPTTSILNLAGPGDTVAGLVTVPLGPDGGVSLFTQRGADLVADLVGYFFVTGGASTRGHVHVLAPARLLDTRDGVGRLDAGQWSLIDTAGLPGLPGPAGGADPPFETAFANLTATDVAADSFLSAAPAGLATTPPGSSNLNVGAGQTRANQAIVAPQFEVYTHAPAALVVDVTGYSAPDGTGELLPLAPRRVLDTRLTGSPHGRLGAGDTVTVHVVDPGAYDVPVIGIIATLTGVDAGGPGYLTAWASGPRPLVSNLNLDAAGQTRPNQILVPVDADGDIQLHSHGAADALIDLTGVLVDRSPPAAAMP